MTSEKQTIDGLEVAVYQIKIPNNPGLHCRKPVEPNITLYIKRIGNYPDSFYVWISQKAQAKTPTNDAAWYLYKKLKK